jgi:hypothetical protein
MNIVRTFGLFLFIAVLSTVKAELISFEEISAAGTGCRPGTMATSISPDGKTVTLLFDSFVAEVPQFSGDNDNGSTSHFDENLDRKICNMMLKAVLPKGEMLSTVSITVDYRGYTFLDPGVSGRFKSFLVSSQGLGIPAGTGEGDIIEKKWRAKSTPVDEDWVISQSKSFSINSKCATDADRKLRMTVKNYIEAIIGKTSVGLGKTGIVVMDSADLVGKVEFKFSTQKCK